MNSKIEITDLEYSEGETFGDAMARCMVSTLEGLRRQAAMQAASNLYQASKVEERRAPWLIRWLPPARKWWDRVEKTKCDWRRACYLGAAAKFAAICPAITAALEGENTCPHGEDPAECNACFVAGDLAFDSWREDQ
jgi:hypothetical protein